MKDCTNIRNSNLSTFNKIIYFDEDSATDLIYMKNGGVLTEELINEDFTSAKVNSSLGAEIGTSKILKSILGGKLLLEFNEVIGESRDKSMILKELSEIIDKVKNAREIDKIIQDYIFTNITIQYFKIDKTK